MSLPHHRNPPIFMRALARLRCAFREHDWRPFDLYSCECLWCGKLRRMPLRDPSPLIGVLDTKPTPPPGRIVSESADPALSVIKQWNAGARIADDCFCPSCGARGFVGTCRNCSQDMGGGK